MSSKNRSSRLRFNFGFLLEADLGTSRVIELEYPSVEVSEDLVLSPLHGSFVATRTSEGVYLSGKLHSVANTKCTRCLEETTFPISFQLDEMFYYPPSSAPDNDQLTFDGETGYIDLSPVVRELSLLEIPIRVVCRPDCLGLCMECGQNLNEGNCDCQDDEFDPRLAALRTLLE